MESEAEAVKPSVTIARLQDRIPTDKSPEEAAALHGAGSVYVDGKCYAEILREQAAPEALADEAPPVDPQPVTEEMPAAPAESAGDANA